MQPTDNPSTEPDAYYGEDDSAEGLDLSFLDEDAGGTSAVPGAAIPGAAGTAAPGTAGAVTPGTAGTPGPVPAAGSPDDDTLGLAVEPDDADDDDIEEPADGADDADDELSDNPKVL